MVMVMDGGTVHLKTGDVLLGRGIVHNWVNTGNEPCVIAFVLVAAEPVVINSNVLVATG
jgi:quercetin dioxygenase-like cupin family protein